MEEIILSKVNEDKKREKTVESASMIYLLSVDGGSFTDCLNQNFGVPKD